MIERAPRFGGDFGARLKPGEHQLLYNRGGKFVYLISLMRSTDDKDIIDVDFDIKKNNLHVNLTSFSKSKKQLCYMIVSVPKSIKIVNIYNNENAGRLRK